MKELMCENCGSKSFIEDNGIPTCDSCGTKYPEFSLNKVGIEEELKEKEIRRLVEANKRGTTLKTSRFIIIIPLLILGIFAGFFAVFSTMSIDFSYNMRGNIGIFTGLIVVIGIIYILYNRGFFHEGRNDLEPSLNILTDEEILKYSPKSKAAKKIKSK